MRRFRTIWKWLVPGWLQRGQGELVQWVEGLMIDAFLEACHQTAYLGLPSVAPSDALDRIGADRAIPKGFAEPEASYRERLRRWRYPRGHRIRGNAPGLLEQIAAVFANAGTFQTIDARGTRYTYGTDGAERGVSWDWDGEALLPNWARFWIVVTPEGATPHDTWGAGAWGPTWNAPEGVCWAGKGVHAGQINAIKQVAKAGRSSWVPAGRRPVYLVIAFDGETYPAPTGDWDEWGNRDAAHRYEPLHTSVT